MPPPSHVSSSSSCPQVSHSLGQQTVHSTWVTPSVQERFQDHHEGPQEGSVWPRSTNTAAAPEAECPAPAPQGPTADDAALWDAAQRIVSEAVRRAVAVIQGPGEQPGEQQDLAQRAELEEEKSKEGCQGEDYTIQSIWVNPSVQEHLQDAPADPQEGSGSPSCTDTEAAAEAQSPAPAQHSPTEDDVAVWDTVEYLVSEATRRALAVTPGPGQQAVEQPELAQCLDVAMAAPTVAGLDTSESPLAGEPEGEASTALLVPAEDTEGENRVSPMCGDHQGEPSTAIVCSAANEEEVASWMPQEPPADAGTLDLAPAADDEGRAAASPVAADPQQQVASQHGDETQSCSSCRDAPEDEQGTTNLPHAPARRPSRFRRALRALRRAFRCSCIAGQQEE
ncbi:uncharacterized protein LOC135993674 [Caloenas nicobarica]|uniref:uncharacterized protein LOC135993674 n=1 Tax=Caloenas nicobarica TaxID=187106 RepID=UPI0032B87DD5